MSKRHRTRQQQPTQLRPRQQAQTVGSMALADAPSTPAQVTRTFTPAPMAGNAQYNAQGNQQWGPSSNTAGEAPSNQFYPNMPTVKDDKPLLTNIGASGTAIFSGVVTSEEYNRDFYWKDGIKIYEQMLRNDGQVNAVREIVEQPILRAEKHIIPGSPSARDKEIASFVETCLFHDMRYTSVDGIEEAQTWDSLLRHILMHLWYGFMCFEQVWRIEDGWVKWARWTPLLPRTVWRWWVGNDNALTGIQQWTFREHNYQFVDIPAKKLVRFHRRLEGQNYEGVSALRSAYKHWFYKVQFEKIEAIGAERNAVIPAVIKLPEGFTQADYTNAQVIVSNIRANESMGVTIPNTWDIEYLRNFQRQAVQLQDSIQYHDVMIARNMLAQFINLGSTETGAYSLDDSQRKDFLSNLQSICCAIEDTINLGPIKQLVDYNFDGVAVYPKLQFGKVLMSDLASMADALSKLTTAGLLHPDPQLEDYIREAGGLPGAPQSVINAYNPTAPTTPSRPDNGNADSHDTQQPTQAKPATNSTTNNGPDDGGSSGDNGGGGDGGGGGALSEVRALADALRETVRAIDPVERGMLFYAPDQARDSHGRFEDEGAPSKASGGTGRGRGGKGGAASKASGKGEHAATGKSGGSGSGGSRSSGGRGKAAKGEKATGERTLEQHTHDELKTMAKAQGVKAGKTKSETIANLRAKGAASAHQVTVHPEADAELHGMFGRNVSHAELAGMVGAPAGAKVHVTLTHNDEHQDAHGDPVRAVDIRMEGHGVSAWRQLYRDGEGHLVMDNLELTVKPGQQHAGVGTHVFAEQVHTLSALGVHRIETRASGQGMGAGKALSRTAYNGYYTWARLGYNGKVSISDIARVRNLSRESVPASVRSARTIHQVMKTAEGRQWWKDNGMAFNGTFLLSRSGASRRILRDYVAERAQRGEKGGNA